MQTIEQRAADLRKCNLSHTEAVAQARYEITRHRAKDAGPELLELLKKLTFIAESVAHLHGMERDILPTTDAARSLIATIEAS